MRYRDCLLAHPCEEARLLFRLSDISSIRLSDHTYVTLAFDEGDLSEPDSVAVIVCRVNEGYTGKLYWDGTLWDYVYLNNHWPDSFRRYMVVLVPEGSCRVGEVKRRLNVG